MPKSSPLHVFSLLAFASVLFFPSAASHAQTDDKIRIVLVGDSTVKNGSGRGEGGLWGWGQVLAEHFDHDRAVVENRARGGRSSRTYITEGLWEQALSIVRPGDFVLIQFGHNDGGEKFKGDRPRASIKGNGDEAVDGVVEMTGKQETVRSYGWYLRKYVADTKAKQATPIVLSLVPRDRWEDGGVIRSNRDYGKWAAEAARQGGAHFIDLNEIVAQRYEAIGEEKVGRELFTKTDWTHTTLPGAKVNAECVVAGIRGLMDCSLRNYLRPAETKENADGDKGAVIWWPEPTQTARPWTRWWWHGSAVDKTNLTRLLENYREAGLGGVEITCIYGVQGNEAKNRQYLSDAWIEAVQHAIEEAGRLGLGVDLPAGSGWRMGGPGVPPADANSKLVIEKKDVLGGQELALSFERSTPQMVLAVDQRTGRQENLTDRISDGRLKWQPPDGNWKVYALSYRWAGDRVKRPGPGGAGLNINPFSKSAVRNFLDFFSQTLKKLPGIRAQFHDSFEYEGDWQPNFLDEFAERRGYRLEEHLPALAGDGPADMVGRVKYDYRQTLADMVLENLVETWVAWAHEHGQLARNQSHGSPANWLDLYAACDIPETESFGRLHGDDADQLVLKFAGSAGNVAGRRLVSSESGTWLDEHFHVTLAQLKQIVDRQILAGVNHVFYHGTAYSPQEADWPGWLFYASTQLNPQNPIWRDFPALNAYLTRVQAILQESKPDNDILLYWPIHDAWHAEEGLRMEVRVHNGHDWFYGHPFGDAAKLLNDQGYAFDYVSDRGLASCQSSQGAIQAPGGSYSVVVVPRARYMPLATLRKLATLARGGAVVLFWGELPESEPGMAGRSASDAWQETIDRCQRQIAAGSVGVGEDLAALLTESGVRRETALNDQQIRYVRERWNGDTVYFIKNEGEQLIDSTFRLATEFETVVIMDPMSGVMGAAEVEKTDDGAAAVRLQIAPQQSRLLVASTRQVAAQPWRYREPSGKPVEVPGPWRVEFLEGGPSLPEGFTTDEPVPWTDAPDASAQKFAGTVRYATKMQSPPDESGRRLLDLGEVLGSARVLVDGGEITTLIGPPYLVEINNLSEGERELSVEVTGVAANRIRDLDRRGVAWRIFEDINLVTIDYQKFDASNWPVRPLGLVGPVTLTPLQGEAE